MANSELIKSKQYKGVYWRQIEKSDGHGTERMYYVIYRRGGRDSKLIKEPVGKTSTGMTEARANIERGKRISGEVLPNTEKREQSAKDKLTGGNLVFERLWELYWQAHESNASIRTDGYNFSNHLKKRLGNKAIPDIQTLDLEIIRKELEKKGRSAQTVKHVLGLVKRVIKHGVKLGICSMPEKLYFEMPKVDNVKTENMNAEQLAAYWQALDEEPDQDAAAFLKVALLTGMRKGALMGLRWQDIDFDKGFITLQGEEAKNERTAKIPLNEAARTILQSISRKSEYVFPGRDGGHRKEYKRISQRVRNKAGLPADFRPCHGLRHTFASHLASSGKVDLYTLQKLLTHSSPQMTQRYAHLADEAMQRAASVANILADPNKHHD